jgi:hypothetical protein
MADVVRPDFKQLRRKPSFTAEDMRAPEAPTPAERMTRRQSSPRTEGPFVIVPVAALRAAARAGGGHTQLVLLAIAYESKLKNSRHIRLTAGTRELFGIGLKAKARGLARLERCGLITVERNGRRNPTIRVSW